MSDGWQYEAQYAMHMYYEKDKELDQAKNRIEQLERELRVYMDAAEGHMVERMRATDQLAAEKALADRLYSATHGGTHEEEVDAFVMYCKARGL